ncbi:maltose transport system, substrate-binding protein [Citrobacter koseri]|uniref:Maltose transport system, substrate-binding protein n=1 Tax=Citrobacter koseri TaxID=545 RepID=A0A078LJF2_CITKO|nr:maltose transport system, substrate-binding protein [Citrobacter koseri]
MREQRLRPGPRPAEEFRDVTCKNRGVFMCANTHYSHLCNTDHIKKGWGVGVRRMERGCRIKKLDTVKPPLCIHEHITKKDGRYENQNWRTHPRIIRTDDDDVFRLGSRQD